MNNNAIQRKLLLKTDLTLDKAVTLAISINQTNEGAKALESRQAHTMSNKSKPNSKACLSKKHSATTSVKSVHSNHLLVLHPNQILELIRMLMIQIFTCLLCQVVQRPLLSMLKFLLTPLQSFTKLTLGRCCPSSIFMTTRSSQLIQHP